MEGDIHNKAFNCKHSKLFLIDSQKANNIEVVITHLTRLCFFFLGPECWHETYPFAKGNNQSPVAILTQNVCKDPILLPWFSGYDPGAAKNIGNTGKTCRIMFDDKFDRSG